MITGINVRTVIYEALYGILCYCSALSDLGQLITVSATDQVDGTSQQVDQRLYELEKLNKELLLKLQGLLAPKILVTE